MGAIALWFEQAATLHEEHAQHDQNKCNAKPINSFHSNAFFKIFNGEYSVFSF
jgi:hypothetical protein